MENHQFKEYNLQPWIHDVIKRLEFKNPTPIQQKVIPAILRHESVIGQSHTGSGKTHAFLIPLFNQIDPAKDEVQAVITSPTRELATQIFEEVKKMIAYQDEKDQVSAKLLIGGTDKQRSVAKLTTQPQIIVATPGRLLDLVKEEAINLYTAKSFVIDEADLMLDLGLIDEVDQMLVRSHEDIQVLVFSATIPERLQPFLKKYLQSPTHVHIKDQLPKELIEHRLIPIRHREPSEVIKQIATVINPYLAIIFTNGKKESDALYQKLLDQGLSVGLMHGGLKPRERKRVLKDIQALKYQYIVATDLAARGIDIKGVSHVINAQLPKEEEFYLHRVGRTARAGMKGTAINLYHDDDLSLIQKLHQNGTEFDTYDITNGQWKEIKPWNERAKRKKQGHDVDKEAWKKVRKPKTVKPGYKKKMKRQQEKIKKQMSRRNKK
ncbi:ATP-dependent RNA helicase CshB [Pelagirhabdus alkalitolerans]|uniref:ATP-dependent RNA helicase CshB n=1 Tax=Pelagirhabdus alkalitolerans TaxID=1612202 RepID=A0A1G6HXA6_9BACI|nr:DEAD/DEAH box helicase [Pelagirhabdus alkalitolerans]SDB98773.1 ATP-dependent RNA helicase CshB [Pelagirhabdus alkalitolerans]